MRLTVTLQNAFVFRIQINPQEKWITCIIITLYASHHISFEYGKHCAQHKNSWQAGEALKFDDATMVRKSLSSHAVKLHVHARTRVHADDTLEHINWERLFTFRR